MSITIFFLFIFVIILLINNHGVFVFESKNYSGWIFGNERSKTWTQTLPQGKGKSHKEHFLNPIMQNKLHIKWIKSLIGENKRALSNNGCRILYHQRPSP